MKTIPEKYKLKLSLGIVLHIIYSLFVTQVYFNKYDYVLSSEKVMVGELRQA
jgi:hypothetical protein